MKIVTSTEFQKSYARLVEPTEVTALGRVIGTYYPVGTHPGIREPQEVTQPLGHSFGTSTPAPKPGKKK